MWNARTDLAIESRAIYKKAQRLEDEVTGIKTNEKNIDDEILLTKVEVISDKGAQILKKPIGKYYTIEAENLYLDLEDLNKKVIKEICDVLRELLRLNENDSVLVVGLGNKHVTPDSLGPRVIEKINVTRHLIKYMPEVLDKHTKEISAISPGVLASTGIETCNIIKAICEKINPSRVIIIDALASKDAKRIKTTIQLSSSGIAPGAGVGNNRERIDKNLLGVPVIAIGVPTVIDSKTLAHDLLEEIFEKDNIEENKKEEYFNRIKNAMPEINQNSIVTPTEIDEIINVFSRIIAEAINQAVDNSI